MGSNDATSGRMMGFKISLGLVVTIVMWAGSTQSSYGQWTSELRPDPSVVDDGARRDRAHQALRLKAASRGSIRVIVSLKMTTPLKPEGELSREEQSTQRKAIEDVSNRVVSGMTAKKMKVIRKFTSVPAFAAEVDSDALEALFVDPDVVDVEEDLRAAPSLTESVPLIRADQAWGLGYSGAGQTIAILDTGIATQHSFLAGKVVHEACFSSNLCPGGVTQASGPGTGLNCPPQVFGCDHGTHVAGIAAGKGASFSGVAKEASLMAIQVFYREDSTETCGAFGLPTPCALSYTSDRIAALYHVREQAQSTQIAAVNMSIGGAKSVTYCDGFGPVPEKQAMDHLRSLGIATVVSSGNMGYTDGIEYPACISTAVSVGATTNFDDVAPYSNSAAIIDLLAPGGYGFSQWDAIYSSVPNQSFQTKTGTSMATPHVAGAWAILKSKRPSATVNEVLNILVTTGVPVLDSRNNLVKPRIQVEAAVNALPTTAPPASSTPTGLKATAVDLSHIGLVWAAPTDGSEVTRYEVQRKSNGGAFQVLADSPTNSFTDTGVTAGSTYVYRVRSWNTYCSGIYGCRTTVSGFSNSDLATAVSFTNDPLVAGTTRVLATHLTELRQAVNAVRVCAGLSMFNGWTDPSAVGVTIKATHIQQLRTRLNEALSALGFSLPTYTDPTLTPQVTLIKSVHVDQVRQAVK